MASLAITTELAPAHDQLKTTRLSARHLPALDGLRAIAILLVLGHHFRFILAPSHPMELLVLRCLDGGWAGVELFFVISGFLITGILLDTRDSESYFRKFYARRALRIFPLYYGYLAFVFIGLTSWWVLHFHSNPWRGINPAWYLLYIENVKPAHMFNDQFLGHLWSLAIEEQFYLVWPLLVLFLNRSWLGFVCVLGISAALISRLFLAGYSIQQSFFLNTLTIASLDSLCAGALIAIIIRNNLLKRRMKHWITAAGIISAIWFVVLSRSAGTLFLYDVELHTWGLFLLNVLFACVIYGVSQGFCGRAQKLLSARVLRSIGRVSYGMYVLHPVVIAFVLPRIHPIATGTPLWLQLLFKIGLLILLTVVSILVALLSWKSLEEPFLKLKKKFEYRRPLQSAGGLLQGKWCGVDKVV